MPSHRGPLLSLLVASTTLLAQEQTTIGRFLTADGTAIANAVVTFATSRQDVFDALAPAKVVTTTTDDRGVFKIKLQHGDVHSLWAMGPASAEGSWRSSVQEGVVAGKVIELRATERVAPEPLRVAVPNELGAGPFTLEVFTAARHAPPLRMPLAADGVVTLPPLPPGRPTLRLLDGNGRVVVGWFWPNGEKTQPAAFRSRVVEVVDENGAPVAKARVAALISWSKDGSAFDQRRPIDVLIEGPPTDATGRSTIALAEHAAMGFVAWTNDRHARLANTRPYIVDGVPRQPQRGARPDEAAPIRLIARPGPVLRGTLRRGTTPLAGQRIAAVVDGECRRVEGGLSSSNFFHSLHSGVTDAEGHFALHDVARPIRALRLAWDLGDGTPCYALPRNDVPEMAVDLDVDTWPLVTMRLRSDGAAPLSTSHFLLWPAAIEHDTQPLVLVGERSGQVRGRFEPGEWFVFATDGESCAVQLVVVPKSETATVELASQPLARMRGRAITDAGKPAAGEQFHTEGWQSSGPVSFGFDGWDEPDDPNVQRLTRLLMERISTIHRGLVNNQRTDADGAFSVPLLPMRNCAMQGYLGGFGALAVEFRPADDLELVLQR